MMRNIDVDITIRDTVTGLFWRIPVLPYNGRISFDDGEKKAVTVDIPDLGDVDIPTGTALDSMGWSSLFPVEYDASIMRISYLKYTPLEYRNRFSAWKDAGTPLQIICPAAGINKTMYLKSFVWDFQGLGDIYYSVGFTELRPIKARQVTPGGTVSLGKTAADRPAAPQKAKPKTYTVVSGDTLSGIGKKLGIAWKTIYDKNKKLIGPDPGKIKPGQVLTL